MPITKKDLTLVRKAYNTLPASSFIQKFSEAWLSLENRNQSEMLDACQTSIDGLEQDPNSIFGLGTLASVYSALGYYSSSADTFSKLLEVLEEFHTNYGLYLERVTISSKLKLADCYLRLGGKNLTYAHSIYKSLLQGFSLSNDEKYESLLGCAKTLLEMSNFEESMKYFIEIDEEHFATYESNLEKAWVKFNLGNISESLLELEKLSEMKETAILRYRIAKVNWDVHRSKNVKDLKGDDLKNVHSNVIQAIKLDQTYSPSFTLLGHYYSKAENDFTRAIKCYTKAIDINPKDEEATKSLSEIYITQQPNPIESFKIVTKFVTYFPRSFWAWKQLGLLNLSSGKLSDSITNFQTALRINVKCAFTWSLLGEAYSMAGKYTASIKAFDRAIETGGLKTAFYHRAVVYYKLAMYQESLSDYKNIIGDYFDSETLLFDIELLPAFRGLAECLFAYSKQIFNEGSYGRCLSTIQSVVEICFKVVKSTFSSTATFKKITSTQSFLKLMGDSFMVITNNFLSNLVDIEIITTFRDVNEYLSLHYASKFYEKFDLKEDKETLKDNMSIVLECAGICYQACIIECLESAVSDSCLLAGYFNDLALTFHYRCNKSSAIINASKCIQLALNFDVDEPEYWNTLGVIKSISDKMLSQHAFIKALELEPYSALVWNNLGVLYLRNNEADLASKCFKKAQFCDPEWEASWFGQAIASDILRSENSFELIEHAYKLGGYSQVIINTITLLAWSVLYLCPWMLQ